MTRNLKILRKKEVWEVIHVDVSEKFLEEHVEPDPYLWAIGIQDDHIWQIDEVTGSDIVIIDDVTPGDEQDIYEGEADFG